ncbi:MAG: adenylate/guanylate cyclase domain-containing protein [Chloroflexota bacterium]
MGADERMRRNGASLTERAAPDSLVITPSLPRVAQAAVAVAAFLGLVIAVQSPPGILIYVPYTLVACILVVRRPRNSIGWILFAIGWCFALALASVDATPAQFATRTVPLATEAMAIASGALGGLPAFTLLFILLIVFPSGRLPHGRWETPARVAIGLACVAVILNAFGPTLNVSLSQSQAGVDIANPLAIFPAAPIWETITGAGFPLLAALLALGVVSIIVRLRRARGIERQQLSWVAAALAFVVIAVLGGFVVGRLLPAAGTSELVWIPAVIAFPTVPLAIGVAVLRYRLYEIDTIINRTVLDGSVTVVLLAAFGVANIGLQRMLESLTGQRSELLTGALGVGVAVAYGPMRRRVRPVVDRLLPGRALLTLLFTDIVGSTERIVELGDERWRMLLGRYRAAVRKELARTGGHEVDTAGDAFFATFDQPSSGVSCARAIRVAVDELSLQTRTGLHLGECEMRGEKVSGIEVHAAARIMASAADGEILISEALGEALPGRDLGLHDRGRHKFKGVPGEWQLFALAPVGGAG